MQKGVWCGFNKWFIGWEENTAAIIIKTSRHPIYEELQLHDASKEDLLALSKFFKKIAEK